MNNSSRGRRSYGSAGPGNGPARAAEGHGGEPSPAAANLATVSSEDLMAGRGEIRIAHRGDFYRLRVTGNGKLILTK